jgi:hypothetical protein
MKNKEIILAALAIIMLCCQANAQQVIASAGGYSVGETVSLSWTLGEPVTETFFGWRTNPDPGFPATLQLLPSANPEYSCRLERRFKLR